MRKLLLIILTLTAWPALGAAQHAAPILDAPIRESGVTLTLSAYLLNSPAGQLMLPLPLLERLEHEAALLAIDTAPVEGRVVVQVRFGFADMAAFQRWYADERITQLLADVRATTMTGSFETMLTFRRPAGP